MDEFGLYLKMGIIVVDILMLEFDIIKQFVVIVECQGYVFFDGFVSGGFFGVCSGIMMMVVGGDKIVFVKV